MWIIRAVGAQVGRQYFVDFDSIGLSSFTKDRDAATRFGSKYAAQIIGDRIWKHSTYCIDLEEVDYVE